MYLIVIMEIVLDQKIIRQQGPVHVHKYQIVQIAPAVELRILQILDHAHVQHLTVEY